MKLRYAAGLAGLALSLVSGAANASVTVDVTQVGGNVVFSSSGSLDLTGLSFGFSSNTGGSTIVPATASFIIGDESGDIDLYGGASRPGSFGPGGQSFSDINTGPSFGYGSGFLFLPTGYMSGEAIVATSTYTGATFMSLGLNPGKYEYKWSSDEVILQIGPTAPTVPLPSSAPMFGAGLIALSAAGYAAKRKKVSASA